MNKSKIIIKRPRVGQKIYVDSSYHLSEGSRDFTGGLATVSQVGEGISGGKKVIFVVVKERPETQYNWTQFLSKDQANLKKEFGKQKAHASPDIDTPWTETGDTVSFGGDVIEHRGGAIY